MELFLSDLAVNGKVAASTQNQAFNALLFLYREVEHHPLGQVKALRADLPITTALPHPHPAHTVTTPYPPRSTSNRLLEVLRGGYGGALGEGVLLRG